MIDFEDVKNGQEEERDLTLTETTTFYEGMQDQGTRPGWVRRGQAAKQVNIGDVFDSVEYQGITSVNALIVEGAQNFEAVSLDEVKRVVDRICAAREVLKKRGYLEEEYPERNGEYTYEFARRTPKEELADELDYLLNHFAAELEASLNSAEVPVQ